MNFFGKNILISGGSSGIGLALAKRFASLGANITILARRENQLYEAINSIKEHTSGNGQHINTIPVQADVRSYNRLKRAFLRSKTKFDVLINSAGIAYPGEFNKLDHRIFKQVIDTNYLGTVNLTKLVVPGMIEQKSGYIVNISSLAAVIGIYGYTAYAPSKYAIRGFSRCLRSELKSFGIEVSVVLPPDTDTPQLAFERTLLPEITRKINENGRVLSADQVAIAILKGMEKKKFTIIPGFEGKILYLLAPIFGRYFYHYSVRLASKQTQ